MEEYLKTKFSQFYHFYYDQQKIRYLQDILNYEFELDLEGIFTQNRNYQIRQHNSFLQLYSSLDLVNKKTREFYESEKFQLFINQQQYGHSDQINQKICQFLVFELLFMQKNCDLDNIFFILNKINQQEDFFNKLKKYLQQNIVENQMLQVTINNVIYLYSQKIKEDIQKKYQIFSLLLLINNLSNIYYFLLGNEEYKGKQYLQKYSHFLSHKNIDYKIPINDIGFQLLISCINSVDNNIIFFHEIMQEECNQYLYFLSDSFQNMMSLKINQIKHQIKMMMKLFLSLENIKQFEVYTQIFFQYNALKIKNKIYDEQIILQIFSDVKKIIFDVSLIEMFENIVKKNIKKQFIDIISRNYIQYLIEIKNVQILQIYQYYEQSSYQGDNLQKQIYSIKLFKYIKKSLQQKLIQTQHWSYENLTKEQRINLVEKFISEIADIKLEQEQFLIIEQILLSQQEIFLLQFSNYNNQFFQHLQFLTKKLCYDIQQDQKQFQQVYTQMIKKLIQRQDIRQNSLDALQNMKIDSNFSQNCTYYYQLIICLFWPEQAYDIVEVQIEDLKTTLSQIINIMENFHHYTHMIGSDCYEMQLTFLKGKLQTFFSTNGMINYFLLGGYSQSIEQIQTQHYIVYYSPELSVSMDLQDQIQESKIKIRIKQQETEVFLNDQLLFLYENMQQYDRIFYLMSDNQITYHQFIKVLLNDKKNGLVSSIIQNIEKFQYENNYSQIMNYMIILYYYLKNSDIYIQTQEFHKKLKQNLQEMKQAIHIFLNINLDLFVTDIQETWSDSDISFQNLINYIIFESVYGMDEIKEDEKDIFYEPEEIQKLLVRQDNNFITMTQDSNQLKAKRRLRLSLILYCYAIQQQESPIFDTFIRNECIIDSQFYQILQSISIDRYRNIKYDNSKIYQHTVIIQREQDIYQQFKKQWYEDVSKNLKQNNNIQFAKNYFANISISGNKVDDQGSVTRMMIEEAYQYFLNDPFFLKNSAQKIFKINQSNIDDIDNDFQENCDNIILSLFFFLDNKNQIKLPFTKDFIIMLFSGYQLKQSLYQNINSDFLFQLTTQDEFDCKKQESISEYQLYNKQEQQQNISNLYFVKQKLFFEKAFQRRHIFSYSFLEYKFWLQKSVEQNIVKVFTNIQYSKTFHPEQGLDQGVNALVTETHDRVKQLLENIINRYIKNKDIKSLQKLILVFCGSSFCDKQLRIEFRYEECLQSQFKFIACLNLLYIGYNFCSLGHMENYLIIEEQNDENQAKQYLNNADKEQIIQLQERMIIKAFENVDGKFTTQ